MKSSVVSEGVSVVCLVLMDASGAVLATQRAMNKHLGGKWEFPGGKIELRESGEEALRREIREELGLELGVLRQLREVSHSYPTVRIRLVPYLAHCDQRPRIELHEHEASCWISLGDWQQLDWAPADVPVIQQLLEMRSGKVNCE